MPLDRTIVLILSTDPAFGRELAARWPAGADRPEFTVLEQGLFRGLSANDYDLAIGDASSSETPASLRNALAAAGKPAILIQTTLVQTTDSAHGCAIPFSRTEGNILELCRDGSQGKTPSEPQSWAEIAGLVGHEILRRMLAEARQKAAESQCARANAEAMLGRYMVEMRHNVNNALTSILGNAELLTSEPGLPANVLGQADTIRNMALRLHEVFQRFSSIEKELSVAARELGKPQARACAARAN